jgi:hypothetical protein
MKRRHPEVNTNRHPWPIVISILFIVSALFPSLSFGDWEFLGGWEADSDNNGYAFSGIGYIHPFNPRLALATRVSGSYLYYNFPEDTGETKVKSPGATLLVGPRFSGERVSLTVMAGAEARTIKRETDSPAGKSKTSEDKVSPVINGALSAQLGRRWDFLGIANYDAANKYIWTRGGLKYRISEQDRPAVVFLGPEVTIQGNSDITSVQGGGMIEVHHNPGKLSLAARFGYKQSTFDTGPSREGPYWGIGFYKQF